MLDGMLELAHLVCNLQVSDADVHNDAPVAAGRLRGGGAADVSRIVDQDVLLAFSHWTWVYTKRKELVYDHAGCKSAGRKRRRRRRRRRGGVQAHGFLHSQHGGGRVYGEADLGREGAMLFLATNDCNELCKLLGIDRCHHHKKRGKK